ncbi:hypothetical protein SeJ_A2198 [Salmonella enterica subsp. enterica serovar Javiana str. GA_MM04042433]|nr:hypothetical protein SeJ_A2198 [Salmonella enterica subsp. enterica serovar Javiana str. GA_MM04042433]
MVSLTVLLSDSGNDFNGSGLINEAPSGIQVGIRFIYDAISRSRPA